MIQVPGLTHNLPNILTINFANIVKKLHEHFTNFCKYVFRIGSKGPYYNLLLPYRNKLLCLLVSVTSTLV
jgi:hypothetical protein